MSRSTRTGRCCCWRPCCSRRSAGSTTSGLRSGPAAATIGHGRLWRATATGRPVADPGSRRLAVVRQDDAMGATESAGYRNVRVDVLLGAAVPVAVDQRPPARKRMSPSLPSGCWPASPRSRRTRGHRRWDRSPSRRPIGRSSPRSRAMASPGRRRGGIGWSGDRQPEGRAPRMVAARADSQRRAVFDASIERRFAGANDHRAVLVAARQTAEMVSNASSQRTIHFESPGGKPLDLVATRGRRWSRLQICLSGSLDGQPPHHGGVERIHRGERLARLAAAASAGGAVGAGV